MLTNATNNGVMEYDSDIKSLSEIIHKQNELIRELTNRLDEKQKRIEERDKILMHSINELLEIKRQISVAEKKKGFFKKLFRKE